MRLSDAVRDAREHDDWDRLIRAMPFAVFLRVRMEVKGDCLTCTLPGQERLVGTAGSAWRRDCRLHGVCGDPVLALAPGFRGHPQDGRFHHRLAA
ncbi:MAG: hypothetical protein IAE88_19660 [Rhodobacteraceae bacterium]|uniref:hypothetical protein n=1 Tax=Accumulibacter sp. TaxID=2053492 RepID=UPI001A0028C9|nr:hypothetical protein [Accumulibacter sp.]MBE2261082.1 hypothetical protein [Paracoccaceae bacterium]